MQVRSVDPCIDRVHVGTTQALEVDLDYFRKVGADFGVEDLPRKKTMLCALHAIFCNGAISKQLTCRSFDRVRGNMWSIEEHRGVDQIGGDVSDIAEAA